MISDPRDLWVEQRLTVSPLQLRAAVRPPRLGHRPLWEGGPLRHRLLRRRGQQGQLPVLHAGRAPRLRLSGRRLGPHEGHLVALDLLGHTHTHTHTLTLALLMLLTGREALGGKPRTREMTVAPSHRRDPEERLLLCCRSKVSGRLARRQ